MKFQYIFKNKCEFFLTILFIIFIVIGVEDNYKMAKIVDIPQVKLVIIIVSLLLFLYCNKILGILGIFVAYEILNFSHVMLNESIISPTYSQSSTLTLQPNSFQPSIEEEIIYKMTPVFGPRIGYSYEPMSSNNFFFF